MKSNLYRLIPNGWHWLLKVENQDWTWLLESFAVMADNTEVFSFGVYTIENGERINQINVFGLSEFLNEDQGYEGGFREFGNYMAAKALGVKTYGQYERNLDKIQAMNPLSNLYHNLEEEFIPNPLCYNEKP